jgi:two-component system sensor histidine kinase TctE
MTLSRSLRVRLFILIICPLIVVAAIAAFIRYGFAERMSQDLYDNTLLAVALTISRDVVLSEGDVLAEELLDSLTDALGDPIYYRVTGPGGRFVTGYSDSPRMPPSLDLADNRPTFFDGEYFNAPVRAVILREFISEPQFGGWVTVEVWQTTGQRVSLSLHLVLQALILMSVVIAAAAVVVWFGISLGLKPLGELRDAVELRSPDDLGPIRRPVPREVKSLVGAMNDLFGRLSQAFAERDAFISNAAHQLRNPVAGIQAQAEAATTAPDEAELRVRVAEVAEAARRTSRLTQQLLSMEKARGRKLHEISGTLDISDIAARVLRRYGPQALRDGVELDFSVTGPAGDVPGDPVMINEALENLVDNAMRYGAVEGGAIRVSVDFTDDDVTVTISDDGPGIPEAEREKIFQRFYRIREDGSDGCGLGLSIVREVAEQHGGSVFVGDATTGSCLCFRLPRHRPGD